MRGPKTVVGLFALAAAFVMGAPSKAQQPFPPSPAGVRTPVAGRGHQADRHLASGHPGRRLRVHCGHARHRRQDQHAGGGRGGPHQAGVPEHEADRRVGRGDAARRGAIVVYVTDMFRFRPLVNKVQEELWAGGPYPPRTILEVHRLNQDDIFEVEGTFYAPVKR